MLVQIHFSFESEKKRLIDGLNLYLQVPFNFKTIKALAKQPLHLATKDQHYKGSITTHHYHSHLQENYYANIAADNKIPRY